MSEGGVGDHQHEMLVTGISGGDFSARAADTVGPEGEVLGAASQVKLRIPKPFGTVAVSFNSLEKASEGFPAM